MSDWLKDISSFQPKQLRKVSHTTVTTVEGQHLVEKWNGDHYVQEPLGWGPGFVVDTRPDLEVACILPGLYLGSQDVACEESILNDLGITHILSLLPESPCFFENQIIYKNVPLLDDESSNLRFYLNGCFQFIDDGRRVGAVLVHCNAGISRAPAVVIAYLMHATGSSLSAALATVRAVRPVARPNAGFMAQLQQYEKELSSQKDSMNDVSQQNSRSFENT